MPVGPTYVPEDPNFQLSSFNSAVTVGAGDVALSTLFTVGRCRQITVGTAGVLYLQGAGDATAVKYNVVAGQQIRGWFILIGGTTNYASATAGLQLVVSL